MELEDVVKEPSGIIEDSTLSGMSLDEFYKAMVSVVFPGYTIFYAVKRTYYIGNGLSDPIQIPEFAKDDQRLIDATAGIAGISFRPYSKHPLYIKAEYLAQFIRVIDEFTRFAVHGICRPSTVIYALEPWLLYRTEIFSELAVTVIKWLTAHLSEHRNVFVDYLANNEEQYHEVYVELVQFIHEYLTQQDNTAKFEL